MAALFSIWLFLMTEQTYKLDKLNVLIVDDSKHMRNLIRSLLNVFGVGAIQEASDGREAFIKLAAGGYDLILCDLVMEPVSGMDFIDRVRKGKDSPDPFIPIIAVTGYTEQFRVTAARDIGINEILAKPISAKELAARIQSVIENPRPFVRTKTYFGPDRRRKKEEQTFYDGVERRRSNLGGDLGLSDPGLGLSDDF
jgi:two-component system chemotaxis response regulator CheY